MSLNTTPRTWIAGPGASSIVTAAQLNAEIRDAIAGVQAAWATYVPTITGITLVNGSIAARWNQVGKTIDYTIDYTFGSSDAITGSPTFTLPTAARTATRVSTDCSAFDTSATAYFPVAAVSTSTTVLRCLLWSNTAGNQFAVISATAPMTWATGDVLSISGRYEAA